MTKRKKRKNASAIIEKVSYFTQWEILSPKVFQLKYPTRTNIAIRKIFKINPIIFTTGQHNSPKRLAIRIVVGAWCCTCFFLVQIYCCNLTSHLTSPNQKPLINSFFEIADTPGINLAIEKGYAIDTLLKANFLTFFNS